MKTYILLDNLEHVLKQIEDKRDEDLVTHPENEIIWKWATNNFENKIAMEKEKIKGSI
ncbi:MAG TPA: hypothetical protein K8V06_05455 [Ligilactobacillus salivarius]|uniref:Uncharacterized protein n=1 Tax=Ligilactobacillus salivarius TaxID=1624 RepID=A0A921IC39_9LACO|nr:hypothetical protein [Ligilactobacillus salivarius]MDN4848309.1 hypothetical protein [Ligilactobacillus salivarius]HJG15571.1 hypothetical protein [Ligilactobacillus salivarius]